MSRRQCGTRAARREPGAHRRPRTARHHVIFFSLSETALPVRMGNVVVASIACCRHHNAGGHASCWLRHHTRKDMAPANVWQQEGGWLHDASAAAYAVQQRSNHAASAAKRAQRSISVARQAAVRQARAALAAQPVRDRCYMPPGETEGSRRRPNHRARRARNAPRGGITRAKHQTASFRNRYQAAPIPSIRHAMSVTSVVVVFRTVHIHHKNKRAPVRQRCPARGAPNWRKKTRKNVTAEMLTRERLSARRVPRAKFTHIKNPRRPLRPHAAVSAWRWR